MSKSSPPPNRRAVEAALLPEELTVLRGQAAALWISPDCWHLVPAFCRPWAMLAAVRLAEKLQAQQDGLSDGRALALACGKLGLKDETVRSLLKRFFWDARGL